MDLTPAGTQHARATLYADIIFTDQLGAQSSICRPRDIVRVAQLKSVSQHRAGTAAGQATGRYAGLIFYNDRTGIILLEGSEDFEEKSIQSSAVATRG